MISRIYVAQKVEDRREELYLKSWKGLNISSKIKSVKILDSYLIDSKLEKEQLQVVAKALTNEILEQYTIDKIPVQKFDYLLEIGYLPGVTDNVAHTVRETILDLLRLKNTTPLAVYTSKVFLIEGSLSKKDAEKIASSLYNPLIERATITKRNLENKPPLVLIKKPTSPSKISLEISDDKLIKIGKEGIMDSSGICRGPLALDLTSMKAIQLYFRKMKRDPTDIELESLAQTWSEHCKHTIFANPIDEVKEGLYRRYIKGATNLIRKQKGKDDFCVSVFSDNAGGIIFDDKYLITHKVETHNTPSILDPFGGAITGIVGVNRDCIGFGLGAKPVANTYGFCFGEPEDTRVLYRDKTRNQKVFPPKRIMEGVIKGVNSGGNCSGIPTISGFVKYDDRYRGKPLVFAGTVGLIPRKIRNKSSHQKKAGKGDYIVMVGGRVGVDGIHGATFSSVVMDSSSPATAVQIGDPITQKKFSDALVKEARDMGLYSSITDDGAGGLSCSVAEMAKESGGAEVYLEKVPLKYPNMEPWQIWISESQERMTLAIPKNNWKKFHELMQKRGVEATVIGEFTNSGKCIVKWKDEIIMDLSLEFLHDGLPQRQLLTTPVVNKYPDPKLLNIANYTKILEELLSDKSICGFSFISEQYDHEVQASSVLKPLSGRGKLNTDTQVFRPVLNSRKGVLVSAATYPSYGDISTFAMSACAIDTVIRNIICAGGSLSHLAILDNYCWCSSNDKERLWQLHESLKACYKYAVGYGTPFISGKDSMFNDFQGYDAEGNSLKISVPPTLLISAIGIVKDIYKTISPEFKNTGDVIYLLGETNCEVGASEYFKLLAKREKNNALGHCVPQVDLEKNIKIYKILEKTIENGLLISAMSVALGGIGIALAKSTLGGKLGCNVVIDKIPGKTPSRDVKLFSESQGRILVTVSPKNTTSFEKLIKQIPHARLGKVGGKKLIITDSGQKIVSTNIQRLSSAYHNFSNKMK